MRGKKSSQKKILVDEAKENSGHTSGAEARHLQTTTHDDTINVKDEKQEQGESVSALDLSVKDKTPTQGAFGVQLSTDVLTNEIGSIKPLVSKDMNVIGDDLILLQNAQGQKRPFDDISDSNENKKFKGPPALHSDDELIELNEKCADSEPKVTKLETENMPPPYDENFIGCFMDVTNELRAAEKDAAIVKKQSVRAALTVLGINKADPSEFKRKTPTATARALIRHKYPNPDPNIGLSQVDNSIIEAIIKYVKFYHEHDTTSKGKLRKAMGNYFALFTHKQKVKSMADAN